MIIDKNFSLSFCNKDFFVLPGGERQSHAASHMQLPRSLQLGKAEEFPWCGGLQPFAKGFGFSAVPLPHSHEDPENPGLHTQ